MLTRHSSVTNDAVEGINIVWNCFHFTVELSTHSRLNLQENLAFLGLDNYIFLESLSSTLLRIPNIKFNQRNNKLILILINCAQQRRTATVLRRTLQPSVRGCEDAWMRHSNE